MAPDERIEYPYEGDERTMLTLCLDYHRATLAMKCEGLTDEQMRRRSVPPSNLSLVGLLRHLAGVESNWFGFWLGGVGPNPRAQDDSDLDDAADADVAEAFEYWRTECENSRRVVETFASLDDVGAGQTKGAGISVRFTLIHMIEEYARHNGHADLLRECIDGTTGG